MSFLGRPKAPLVSLPTDLEGKTIQTCILSEDEVTLHFTDGTRWRAYVVPCDAICPAALGIEGYDTALAQEDAARQKERL